MGIKEECFQKSQKTMLFVRFLFSLPTLSGQKKHGFVFVLKTPKVFGKFIFRFPIELPSNEIASITFNKSSFEDKLSACELPSNRLISSSPHLQQIAAIADTAPITNTLVKD